MAVATEFIPKKYEARVRGDQGGHPQHGLKAQHDTKAVKAQNW
jgi:hypothetical protein